jgi:hypothetical protein
MDDVERTVKNINNLKLYATFLHSVMGVPFLFSEKSIDSELSKEKNYENLSEQILEEFAGIDLDYFTYPDFLDDESQLMGRFAELEDLLIKVLDMKQTYIKELRQLEKINSEELAV